jgi:3-deoxy-D-manno-octulosonate 8-phosphate phosphatase (KDO 8-P phosphatase)
MAFKENLANVRLVVFDFDGVFTDNSVWVTQEGYESVRCWRSDGIGLQRLSALGVQLAILSTETNPVVAKRAGKLRLACRHSVEDKGAAIIEICREFGIPPKMTMFVGNDINDIPAFKIVGFPVGVADSYCEIFAHVHYLTGKKGGLGAVREICDLVSKAIDESTSQLKNSSHVA